MYFWNIKALREDLARSEVTQVEQVKYVLAWALYNTFAVQNALWTREPVTWFTIVKAALVLLINVGGILLCYRANSLGDGRNFIDRFICLSWPIIVRITVIVWGGFAAMLAILEFYEICTIPYLETIGSGVTLLVFLITIVGEAVYYLWLRSAIADVSARSLRISPSAGIIEIDKGGSGVA
jgi:hypothetical protein